MRGADGVTPPNQTPFREESSGKAIGPCGFASYRSHPEVYGDFRVSPFRVRPSTRYVKAVTQQGELVAIGQMKLPNVYHPFLVL